MIKQKSPARKIAKKAVLKIDNAESLQDAVVEGMQEKKGKEIVCIDLRNIKNAIADFFVICHADSRTHVDTIAKSVEEIVFKRQKEEPFHREGYENSEWILLDYMTVVAHIFHKEQREFYGIERLWADAEIKRIAGNY